MPPLCKKSIEFLLGGTVDYEFRTTVVREFHTEDDLLDLAVQIRGAQRYYLQSFVDGPEVLQAGLRGYGREEMEELKG